MSHITDVALFRLDLPLAEPFRHASSGRVDTLEEVVCRIRTDAGIEGWGEVRGNCAYVTGDTAGRVAAVASSLARLLLGHPVDGIIDLHRRLDQAIVGNSAAKALLDIALHDAAARALGVSVASLLGGALRDRLPTDASVPFMARAEAAACARRAVREGFQVIKVRVGSSQRDDEDRLTAVREAIDSEPGGQDVVMAADANGTWEPKTAVGRLQHWHGLHLGWIEQPVPADDIDGLRFVREHAAVPVMADESAKGPREVLHLVERRAVDLLHFKLIKAGGFAPLRAMMAIAEAAGIPYMVGQMDEGMLATAAAVAAGAASQARYFEVHGYARVARQPFRGLEFAEGAMIVPPGPGLGVEVDEAALTPVHVERA